MQSKKYGTEHPMQNPKVLAKNQASSFRQKPYTFPSGRKVMIMGYENIHLDFLLKEGTKEEDIVCGDDEINPIPYQFEGKTHYYYPDIYIKSKNLFIEIKSVYTHGKNVEMNKIKWQSTKDKGFGMEVYVYNCEGDNEEIIVY